jgi:TPR repeat protein
LGEVDAMFELAGRLLEGDGVPVDVEEGVKWLQQSAHEGHAYAMYILGCYLLDGVGLEANRDEAIKWLQRAAEADITEAQKLLDELK